MYRVSQTQSSPFTKKVQPPLTYSVVLRSCVSIGLVFHTLDLPHSKFPVFH